MNKKTYLLLLGFTLVMMLIDIQGGFSYWGRSLLKISFFGLIPLMMFYRQIHLSDLFKKGKHLKLIVGTSVVVLLGFGLIFLVLNHYALFEGVKASLSNQVGVNTSNYPLVFIYVVLINGPLEEFFFRYLLQKSTWPFSSTLMLVVSSFFFAIYHVGMLFTMFPWYLFGLAIIGLMGVGIFFSTLNRLNDSINYSIIVHMAANIAINTIGAFLLYS